MQLAFLSFRSQQVSNIETKDYKCNPKLMIDVIELKQFEISVDDIWTEVVDDANMRAMFAQFAACTSIPEAYFFHSLGS